MKTCVIIPTYNEERAITGLVRQIRQQGLEVVVIDDGSYDNTSQLAQESGATVLRNSINEGKGASLIRGFDYALSKDFEAIITMDGDGQHLPEDIPYFMRLAEHSDTSVFIGNRMLDIKSMPQIRILTNRFMSWFLSKVIKQKVLDTQCGFRLIKREVLRKIKLKTHKYETESEILVRASSLGFKIESVPIKTIYSMEKSQINPFIDTLRFIRFIFKEIWKKPF
jgi:glycosyltransferase involved in cell wall biosynthesis